MPRVCKQPERLALEMKTIQTGTVWLPKDPDAKQRRRRPSRHCSRVCWPRFPHLAPRPHPSRHGDETTSSHSAGALCQKHVRRSVRRRDRGQRPTATEIRIRNDGAGGQAAAVAGYVGPGFHNWPPGHIPQDTDTKPLLRIRPSASAKTRSARRSAPRPGSATHGYRRSGAETTAPIGQATGRPTSTRWGDAIK